jgi:hypothetical protein
MLYPNDLAKYLFRKRTENKQNLHVAQQTPVNKKNGTGLCKFRRKILNYLAAPF